MIKLIDFVYFTSPPKVGMFEMTLMTYFFSHFEQYHFYACMAYVDVGMMINISYYYFALQHLTCNICYFLIMGNNTFVM